jgi:acyl-CoA synthetase (AMP-forming)/AMP-acid ligase II
VLVHDTGRFNAESLLDTLVRCGATTLCAPPTVWRMLVQQDLTRWQVPMRELVSAGEPLNPEVIEHVRQVWGRTVRDGYGQTETTAQIGNPPGADVTLGAMGRPLPGYAVDLVDPLTGETGEEGEICLSLDPRPAGLMTGYRNEHGHLVDMSTDGWYHTGDVARRDAGGTITYVGRTDDVFKASDYRISPFELESVLVEHDAVAEAAVVPAPDPVRTAVPKAYVTLAAGWSPSAETAEARTRRPSGGRPSSARRTSRRCAAELRARSDPGRLAVRADAAGPGQRQQRGHDHRHRGPLLHLGRQQRPVRRPVGDEVVDVRGVEAGQHREEQSGPAVQQQHERDRPEQILHAEARGDGQEGE